MFVTTCSSMCSICSMVTGPLWTSMDVVVQTSFEPNAACSIARDCKTCVQLAHVVTRWCKGEPGWSKYPTPLHQSHEPWHYIHWHHNILLSARLCHKAAINAVISLGAEKSQTVASPGTTTKPARIAWPLTRYLFAFQKARAQICRIG